MRKTQANKAKGRREPAVAKDHVPLEVGYLLWIDGKGRGKFYTLADLFEAIDGCYRDWQGADDAFFLWEIEDCSKGFDVAPTRRAFDRLPVVAWRAYQWNAKRFEEWLSVFGWRDA